jgi:hypothetical protein
MTQDGRARKNCFKISIKIEQFRKIIFKPHLQHFQLNKCFLCVFIVVHCPSFNLDLCFVSFIKSIAKQNKKNQEKNCFEIFLAFKFSFQVA